MPNAILEGMASGLAVIATPVGGIPSLIASEDQGLLVDVADANELAFAMQQLIADRSRVEKMGEFNRAHAHEKHDVHVVRPVTAELLGISHDTNNQIPDFKV